MLSIVELACSASSVSQLRFCLQFGHFSVKEHILVFALFAAMTSLEIEDLRNTVENCDRVALMTKIFLDNDWWFGGEKDRCDEVRDAHVKLGKKSLSNIILHKSRNHHTSQIC